MARNGHVPRRPLTCRQNANSPQSGIGQHDPAAISSCLSQSSGMVCLFQPRSYMTSKVLWQTGTNATEQQPFFSICRGKSDTIRDTTNRLWEQCWNHAPVFAHAQGHRGRAAMAKPEILRRRDVARPENRVIFETKESALFKRAKRGGTRRIGALAEHFKTSIALGC